MVKYHSTSFEVMRFPCFMILIKEGIAFYILTTFLYLNNNENVKTYDVYLPI